MTLDYRIVGPGMFMTATSYGLGRYAYGLFIPTFREALSDKLDCQAANP